MLFSSGSIPFLSAALDSLKMVCKITPTKKKMKLFLFLLFIFKFSQLMEINFQSELTGNSFAELQIYWFLLGWSKTAQIEVQIPNRWTWITFIAWCNIVNAGGCNCCITLVRRTLIHPNAAVGLTQYAIHVPVQVHLSTKTSHLRLRPLWRVWTLSFMVEVGTGESLSGVIHWIILLTFSRYEFPLLFTEY